MRLGTLKDTDQKTVRAVDIGTPPVTDEDRRQALLLATGDFLRTSANLFGQQVATEIGCLTLTAEGEALRNTLMDKSNSDFPNTDSFKNVIFSNLAHEVMYIIWRESEFVSENALSVAGLSREFQASCRHLTRNSLKNRICDTRALLSSSDGDAIKRSIDRICDALEVYGLVERTELRPNLKPMCGTRRLHNVMERANLSVAHLFARQLQTKEGAEND